MLSGFHNNSIKNINHTLNSLLTAIGDQYDETFSQNLQLAVATGLDPNTFSDPTCQTNFDISKLIPLWVLFEKNSKISNGEQNVISIFDFLQKYYDWLYCDSDNGAQYSLGLNLLDTIDIQKTRDVFVKKIYQTYFSSLPYDTIQNDPNRAIDVQTLKNFIVNIKKNFHGRKTNIESINYFFTKLFGIAEEDIIVYFPKKDILRLNGGMFQTEYFAFVSATGDYDTNNTLGSYLNHSRFQDNDWFHDWSYLVFLGQQQDDPTLKEAYVNSLHPIGLKLIFGKQITDYQGVGQNDETSVVCEYPMLKNYAAYKPDLTYPAIGNVYGITLYGLSGCSGCNGSYQVPSATGFTGPIHVLPTWTGSITTTRFFDINILSFLQFCYDAGLTSPNEFKTCSGC